MPPKTVLITGCSAGGIGSSLALAFAQKSNSYHVFATARNPDKMTHLQDVPNITTLTLDPKSPDSVQSAFERITALTSGTLDVLINNAGQSLMYPILDCSIAAAQEMYEINLWGALRMTQTFAPLVIAAKGTLVFMGSGASAVRMPYIGVYASSKAALAQLANTLRVELGPFGVRVLTVMTGMVQTHSNDVHKRGYELPEGSLYKSIEGVVRDRVTEKDGNRRGSPDDFARELVRDVERGTNAPVWRGNYMGFAKFMTGWLSWRMVDAFSSAGNGLEKLKVEK